MLYTYVYINVYIHVAVNFKIHRFKKYPCKSYYYYLYSCASNMLTATLRLTKYSQLLYFHKRQGYQFFDFKGKGM